MPRRRSPARFLAPIALVAIGVAVFLMVQTFRDASSSDGGTSTSTVARGDGSRTTASDETSTTGTTGKKKKQRRTYTVKSGDILSTVAEKTGLTVEELEELNPDIDPQALQVGQKLKLRPAEDDEDADANTTTTP